MPLEWIFDRVPASGARLGGDPSHFVFDATLDTFVREVLQNATDQRALDQAHVQVRFVVDELRGDRLDAFRLAFGWETLQEHLAAVLASRGQTEFTRFERALEAAAAPVLRVLWIEDSGTTGLTGPEAGDGAFAALCRDRLFSNKLNVSAGGSFGLGKAVLWRFSRWSTVAFCSRLAQPEPRGHTRFIAKAALPWHVLGEHDCAGDGWLGAPEGEGPEARAVSVWDDDAVAVATALGATLLHDEDLLPEGVGGTAIGVVGFEEPAAEELATPRDLADKLWVAAARSFWPAMALGSLQVAVNCNGEDQPAPTSDGHWRQMHATYLQRAEEAALLRPGDVVVEPITVTLPAERSIGGKPQVAVADLVVRLALPEEPDRYELACFRGAGMVVERKKLDRLSAGARPFHALLICGSARRDAGEADGVLERFLRDAEPPSHDKWTSTPRLRDAWKLGYKKALDGLWSDAIVALRRYTAPPVVERDDGPLGLRKLFPKLGTTAGGRSESAFHFRQLNASFSEGRWQFSGQVRPNVPVAEGWSVRVDARLVEAGGQGIGALVATIETVGGAGQVQEGVALIDAPPGTGEVAFIGQTEPERFPVSPERACFELVVSGRSP